MKARDWYIGIGIVLVGLIAFRAFPRYEWRGPADALVRVDRWAGRAEQGKFRDHWPHYGRWMSWEEVVDAVHPPDPPSWLERFSSVLGIAAAAISSLLSRALVVFLGRNSNKTLRAAGVAVTIGVCVVSITNISGWWLGDGSVPEKALRIIMWAGPAIGVVLGSFSVLSARRANRSGRVATI